MLAIAHCSQFKPSIMAVKKAGELTTQDPLELLEEAIHACRHDLRGNMIDHLQKYGRMNVDELRRMFRIEHSVCSQHLRILREAGLVIGKREGKYIYYEVSDNIKKLNDLAKQWVG